MKYRNLYIFLILICCCRLGVGQNSGNSPVHSTRSRDTTLQTGIYYIIDSITTCKRCTDTSHCYYIYPVPILTVKNFKKISFYTKYSQHLMLNGIELTFVEFGTKTFSEATKKSVGKMLAFIIDNKLVFAPQVMSEITKGRAIIFLPNRTKPELKIIKEHLKTER